MAKNIVLPNQVKDLTGHTYGILHVKSFSHIHPKGYGAVWNCQCECGNTRQCIGSLLKKQKSCGCQNPKKLQDLTGCSFGRLRVLSLDRTEKGKGAYWLCQCECGNKKVVQAGSLKGGLTRSCGCLSKEASKKIQQENCYKHGHSGTKIYRAWAKMRARCSDTNDKRWDQYGGRGIRVCGRWDNSFEAFLEDMGYPPSAKHSIDRIDVNGDYCPNNCRWATNTQQARNRRTNRLVTFQGQTKCLAEWAECKNIRQGTLWMRLYCHKWPIDKALNTPDAHR